VARALGVAFAAGLSLVPAGCEEHEYAPPDHRTERVAEAAVQFDEAAFDTIAWESGEIRIRDGGVVYATHCRRCHAPDGHGETEYARQRGIDVPSLVRADWPDDVDVPEVRRRIFTGHPGGMPTFGVAGITPREIDAVAAYVLLQLRPEFTE
jgi:mono/diheme cytochrome c family protein